MLSKTKNKGCSANCSKFSCQMLLWKSQLYRWCTDPNDEII